MRRCSRGADVPSVCQTRSLAKVRAQGSRVPVAPAASCAKVKSTRVSHHRYRRIIRLSPRDGLTAYSMFSPETGIIVSVASAMRSIVASIGATGPHGFAVRDIYRSSFRYCRAHRIPRPTSVTIAKRPSCGRGTVRILPVIWGDDQLRHIGTTGKSLVAR